MEISQENVDEIVAGIWSSIFGQEALPADADKSKLDGESRLTGHISITGAWDGVVNIDCPQALVQEAAATMFGMEIDELGTEEIEDTLGELTNMIAGNIKTLLPQPCTLSMPSVAHKMSVPGAVPLHAYGYDINGKPLFVTILTRDSA